MIAPHRVRPLIACSVAIIALVAVGCAKRPVSTLASAPAPTGAAAMTAPPTRATTRPGGETRRAASSPGARGTASAGAGAAPTTSPAEFKPTEALQDIHFDFDRSEIRAEDTKILDANAVWLKAHQGDLVLIEGHADERGTNEYNLALGDRRSKSARDYLVGQGVAATRVTVLSYGEERPLCTDHTEACWAQNRRAHFLVKAQ